MDSQIFIGKEDPQHSSNKKKKKKDEKVKKAKKANVEDKNIVEARLNEKWQHKMQIIHLKLLLLVSDIETHLLVVH